MAVNLAMSLRLTCCKLRDFTHPDTGVNHQATRTRFAGVEPCVQVLCARSLHASVQGIEGGATHSLTEMSRLPPSSLTQARQWPMWVKQEPVKASPIGRASVTTNTLPQRRSSTLGFFTLLARGCGDVARREPSGTGSAMPQAPRVMGPTGSSL